MVEDSRSGGAKFKTLQVIFIGKQRKRNGLRIDELPQIKKFQEQNNLKFRVVQQGLADGGAKSLLAKSKGGKESKSKALISTTVHVSPSTAKSKGRKESKSKYL